jgi:hypothetical protein
MESSFYLPKLIFSLTAFYWSELEPESDPLCYFLGLAEEKNQGEAFCHKNYSETL